MRYEKTVLLKNRSALRIKKVMAVAIAFLIVFGISIADRNCAEMTNSEEFIIPEIILVEEGVTKIKFLGKEWIIDTSNFNFLR